MLKQLGRFLFLSVLAFVLATNGATVRADTYTPSYSDYNLILGDATWACPGVSVNNKTDIAITADSLIANVNKRAAQVHADSFFKIENTVATVYYQIQFSQPYQPRPDPAQQYNPQTIESAAEIWRGDTKMKYAGIQWVINPWVTPHINVWRDVAWIPVFDVGIVRGATYRYTVYLDWQNSGSGYAVLEQMYGANWNMMGKWQSWSSVSVPSRGPDISWWVSAEIISATPSCGPTQEGFIDETRWFSPYVVTTMSTPSSTAPPSSVSTTAGSSAPATVTESAVPFIVAVGFIYKPLLQSEFSRRTS